MPTEKELREQAEEYAEEQIGFVIHLVVYLGVNTFLFFVWYFSNRGFPWFVLVLGGWGIGLLAHFTRVFLARGLKHKWMAREMDRLKREQK